MGQCRDCHGVTILSLGGEKGSPAQLLRVRCDNSLSPFRARGESMKPIQEQEWRQDGDAARVVTASGVLVADVIGDREERAARIAAISAAPDMARALLKVKRCPHKQAPCDTCVAVMDAALRKAGVL
jgi:hypothetical protein